MVLTTEETRGDGGHKENNPGKVFHGRKETRKDNDQGAVRGEQGIECWDIRLVMVPGRIAGGRFYV